MDDDKRKETELIRMSFLIIHSKFPLHRMGSMEEARAGESMCCCLFVVFFLVREFFRRKKMNERHL